MLSGATVRVRGDREPPPSPHEGRLVLFPAEGLATAFTAGDAGDDLVLVVPDGTWAQAGQVHRRARGAGRWRCLPAASAYGLRRNARRGVCTLGPSPRRWACWRATVEAALRDAFTLWHERAQRARRSDLGGERRPARRTVGQRVARTQAAREPARA